MLLGAVTAYMGVWRDRTVLQEAVGFLPVPHWHHHGLVADPHGRRLAIERQQGIFTPTEPRERAVN